MGTDYGYIPRVRVRNHAYGYELGFGYETMGMVMGKGPACYKVMGTGMSMGTQPWVCLVGTSL